MGEAQIEGCWDPEGELALAEGFENVDNCAVCGSAGASSAWTAYDRLTGFEGSFPFVRCETCGTMRMTPRPLFEHRRRSFSDDYPLFDWALGRKEADAGSRIARFASQMDEIGRRKQPGRLLDVGCGDGYFLLGMKKRGWDVRGIELHPPVAAFARERLGLEVTAGPEHEVEWGGKYDCITALGVIEDVDDPNAMLERCHGHLQPDGLLVLQTHNIESLEARWFGPDWFNVEAPRHVWHFSPSSLRRLLENNRFGLRALRHYGSSYVTERSIENRRGGCSFPSSLRDRIVRKAIVTPAAKLLPMIGQGIMIEAYCVAAGLTAAAGGPRLQSKTDILE